MKILLVTKELPFPVNNGHRMRSINILKGIAAGNQVDVICMGQEDAMVEAKEALNAYFNDLTVVPATPSNLLAKVSTLIASVFSQLPYSILLRYSKQMRAKIEQLCNDTHYDCIVCDGIHMMVNVPEVSTKVVLSEHNIESMIIKRYADIATGFKKRFAHFEYGKMNRYEKRIWARSNTAFVCSEDDKQMVCEVMSLEQVFVVPNGVDVENYVIRDAVKKTNNSLIYTGLMGWAPNEDAVCYFADEIYPAIKAKIPDVRFAIVGKNPKERVKSLGERDASIQVTGFVDDIQQYMCEADIFIVPIRIGSGTRLKILEALSLQMTIVSTSIGCEGIEVTDGDNIIIRDNPQEFADAIIDILQNKADFQHLGKNGRKLVEEKYSWESIRRDLNQNLAQSNQEYANTISSHVTTLS